MGFHLGGNAWFGAALLLAWSCAISAKTSPDKGDTSQSDTSLSDTSLSDMDRRVVDWVHDTKRDVFELRLDGKKLRDLDAFEVKSLGRYAVKDNTIEVLELRRALVCQYQYVFVTLSKKDPIVSEPFGRCGQGGVRDGTYEDELIVETPRDCAHVRNEDEIRDCETINTEPPGSFTWQDGRALARDEGGAVAH